MSEVCESSRVATARHSVLAQPLRANRIPTIVARQSGPSPDEASLNRRTRLKTSGGDVWSRQKLDGLLRGFRCCLLPRPREAERSQNAEIPVSGIKLAATSGEPFRILDVM